MTSFRPFCVPNIITNKLMIPLLVFLKATDVNDVSFTNCFVDFYGPQIRFNVQIRIVLRLNALLLIYILPENTEPHCNYKNIVAGERGGQGGGAGPPMVMPLELQLNFIKRFSYMLFLLVKQSHAFTRHEKVTELSLPPGFIHR